MRPSARRVMSLTAAAALTVTLTPVAHASEPGEFLRREGEFLHSEPAPMPSTPAVGAASGKSTPALNLTVEPLWSGAGEKLTARGEVYDATTYRPLAGRPLLFQARNLGSSTWTTIARPETNSNGAFRVNLTGARSRTYRAVYSGNPWYSSKHSNWVRQTAAPGTKVRTSARLYPTRAGGTKVQGRLTKLWSSSTRPLRAANVYIQARQPYGSYWFDAGHAKTNAHGYYNWNTSVKPNACYRYRAIYKGNSTWAAKSTTTYWSNCT